VSVHKTKEIGCETDARGTATSIRHRFSFVFVTEVLLASMRFEQFAAEGQLPSGS